MYVLFVKTMKAPLFRFYRRATLPLVIGFCLAHAASRAAADEVVADWDFSRAAIVEDTIVVPATEGEAGDLIYKPKSSLAESGVKIEKKDGESGPNVVCISGHTPLGMVSQKKVSWEHGEHFRIDADVNPTGTDLSYIIRSFFALEYYGKDKKMSFIVWPDGGGKAQNVSMKMHADEWNAVSAQFSNGEISLTVNGETKTFKLPDGWESPKINSSLLVAHPATNAERTFAGKIAKLRVTKLP